jgi:hypothetical protein
MPSSQTIIEQLTLASNSAASLAIGWHVAIALGVAALLLGWRPSNRAAGIMLAAPIVSAAAVALTFGNPFNGSILGALACALVLLARRLGPNRVARGSTATTAASMLMIGFGFFYPHFVASGTPLAYLYAAPTGLIPCPTLSLVIGFALLGGGLGSRAWSISLAAVGLFYGLFGVLRLRVYLDIPLIFGAATLLTVEIAGRRSASVPARGLPWIDRAAKAGTP